MKIITDTIEISTGGNPDLLDITPQVMRLLAATKLIRGSVTLFVIGSTAALTTFEYEPGLVKDMRDVYEKIAPVHKRYSHDETWGDANGYSHVRASLQGPSLTVPFEGGKLLLGTWQQVVLAEFDNRPRDRRVVAQFVGE
jgi:secondary thiamine-phosphate synthase enzyme